MRVTKIEFLEDDRNLTILRDKDGDNKYCIHEWAKKNRLRILSPNQDWLSREEIFEEITRFFNDDNRVRLKIEMIFKAIGW